MRYIKFFEAINESLEQSMRKDPKIILMGLGVTDPKGIFGTTLNLINKFGKKKVIETPTSENAITGIAIGLAIEGFKPILSHQRVEFSLLSMEQIINQAAKWHFMSAGEKNVPIVIRLIIGKGWGQGPQHSQGLEVLFSHIPGLKVVSPSNANDAKGMLNSSIKDKNPIIFYEHRWLHNTYSHVPKKHFYTPIGKAKIVKKGNHITVVSFSYAILEVLKCLKILKSFKINIELIDLRTLRPLDHKTIINSVKKTGRLLVIDNSWTTYGISAEIISLVVENIGMKLKNSPKRLGVKNVSIPSSKEIAKYCYLNPVKIIKTISEITKISIDLSKIEKNIMNQKNSDIPYSDFKGPF